VQERLGSEEQYTAVGQGIAAEPGIAGEQHTAAERKTPLERNTAADCRQLEPADSFASPHKLPVAGRHTLGPVDNLILAEDSPAGKLGRRQEDSSSVAGRGR